MLEKEFDYYLEHQQELVERFNGKFLVIKDCAVIGSYDKKEDAYFDAQKSNRLGTFIIQECTPGNLAYTHTFYNQNVLF